MRLRGATWNVLTGRPPAEVWEEVTQAMVSHGLVFVCLQEVKGSMGAALGRLARRDGYILVRHTHEDWPDMGESAVLLRPGTRHSRDGVKRLTHPGWPGRRGGVKSRWLTFVLVDGWLWVGSGHWPRSTDYVNRRPWIVASLARRRAARRMGRNLYRWGSARTPAHLVVGADFNDPPRKAGRRSPTGVAARWPDGSVCAGTAPTHPPAEQPIDWFVGNAVYMEPAGTWTVGKSDHRMFAVSVSSRP